MLGTPNSRQRLIDAGSKQETDVTDTADGALAGGSNGIAGVSALLRRRWLKIFTITTGPLMQAIILTGPWQWRQVSMLMLKTRFSRWTQVIEACLSMKVRLSGSAAVLVLLAAFGRSDGDALRAVRCKHAIEAHEVDHGIGDQRCQLGDEV